MSKIISVPATRDHCQQLAPYMKTADVREVKLASGLVPLKALETSLDLSEQATAFLMQGRVVAISGVVRLDTLCLDTGVLGPGIVWALTAPLSGWKKTFWEKSQEIIFKYQKAFPLLTNYCDVNNKETICYLSRLGFVFIRREEQFGTAKKPFYQFVRIG